MPSLGHRDLRIHRLSRRQVHFPMQQAFELGQSLRELRQPRRLPGLPGAPIVLALQPLDAALNDGCNFPICEAPEAARILPNLDPRCEQRKGV